MTTWLTVIVAGIGCYLLRVSLVVLLSGRQPSTTTMRVAGYVMPAAFASLAAAALLRTGGAGTPHPAAALLGAAVTGAVAVRTSSSTTALIAGVATAAVATSILPL